MMKIKDKLNPGLALQICGTGSNVGKTVIVSALCRIFLQDGYRVCPFKAQNMALNSFVTQDSGEIGRAQATQAAACCIEASVDMNPVLIKPASDTGAQIILQGRPIGTMNSLQYTGYKKKLFPKIKESFRRLSAAYDIVVIEGAGSPAEINLKKHDIVNMRMARFANAPVILVGDIDKGGVFAHIIGTLVLLTPAERKMVKGIIINKFRGNKKLLHPGIEFLEKRTGIKVLGVIPYFSSGGGSAYGGKDIRIPEEDSVSLEQKTNHSEQRLNDAKIHIAVIKLPHISNFTDFDALQKEPDAAVHYVKTSDELDSPDAIIIPGTKNTISDLLYLKRSGLAEKMLLLMRPMNSTILLGICGGYQMLGRAIYDRHAIESKRKKIEGLGMLPIETHLEKEKILAQVKAKEIASRCEISGYEIHHGQTKSIQPCKPFFHIIERSGKKVNMLDGAVTNNGRVWGTYLHGIFDSDRFRRTYLNRLREKKGWKPLPEPARFNQDREFDKLANLVRENINMDALYKIILNYHTNNTSQVQFASAR